MPLLLTVSLNIPPAFSTCPITLSLFYPPSRHYLYPMNPQVPNCCHSGGACSSPHSWQKCTPTFTGRLGGEYNQPLSLIWGHSQCWLLPHGSLRSNAQEAWLTDRGLSSNTPILPGKCHWSCALNVAFSHFNSPLSSVQFLVLVSQVFLLSLKLHQNRMLPSYLAGSPYAHALTSLTCFIQVPPTISRHICQFAFLARTQLLWPGLVC